MQAYVTALLVAMLTGKLLATLAPMLRLVDRPDARKQHEGAVPVVGGIAALTGFLVAAKLAGIAGNLSDITLPVGLLVALGVVDDARPVRATDKLVAQLLCSWLVVKVSGLAFEGLGVPGLGRLELGIWAVPVTTLVLAALVNALNMIDGIDGLSGGVLIVALVMLALIATDVGDAPSARLLLVMQAGVLGFLVLNVRTPWRKRAQVFLGDAGAFGVGLVMGWYMLRLGGGPAPKVPVTVLLSCCALPLIDLLAVSLGRMRDGRSPFAADRHHGHHLLLELGFSVPLAALAGWVVSALLALLPYGLWRAGWTEGGLLGVMLAVAAAYTIAMHRLWRIVAARRAPEGP